MLGLHELWDGVGALRTSLPFAFALPLVVALMFAFVVDWIERRLNAGQEREAQDRVEDADSWVGRWGSWKLESTSRPLAKTSDHGREHA
jgi:hypothetical protein